jgi:hypothetical protein
LLLHLHLYRLLALPLLPRLLLALLLGRQCYPARRSHRRTHRRHHSHTHTHSGATYTGAGHPPRHRDRVRPTLLHLLPLPRTHMLLLLMLRVHTARAMLHQVLLPKKPLLLLLMLLPQQQKLLLLL